MDRKKENGNVLLDIISEITSKSAHLSVYLHYTYKWDQDLKLNSNCIQIT